MGGEGPDEACWEIACRDCGAPGFEYPDGFWTAHEPSGKIVWGKRS